MKGSTIKIKRQGLDENHYLNIIRCPECLGKFEPFEGDIKCASCNFVSSKKGVVQMLCKSSKKIMTQPLSLDTLEQWQYNVRKLYVKKQDHALLNDAVSSGNIAIKLFVRPLQGLTVLNLGCGSGLLNQDIATQAKVVYAVDQNITALQLAQHRHQVFNQGDNIHLIAIGKSQYLPFADDTFDVVFISEHWYAFANHKLEYLATEICRILKADGQLHLSVKNKYSFSNLSIDKNEEGKFKCFDLLPDLLRHVFCGKVKALSSAKYSKVLQQSGLIIENINHQKKSDNSLLQIRPSSNPLLEVDTSRIQAPIKQKIKQSDFFSPSFSYVCSLQHQKNHPSLFDVILHKIAQELSLSSTRSLKISALNITGKHKGVMVVKGSDSSYIVKLPFDHSGTEGEQNNAVILNRLSQLSYLLLDSPKIMTNGSVDGQSYFVESLCSGESLQQALPRYGRDHFASEVFQAWKLLVDFSHPLITSNTVNVYEYMIVEAAQKIRKVTCYPDKLDVLVEFMHQKLAQCNIRSGLFHGDFSVSNLFTQKGRVSGLIDWETGSFEGPVILDLINIYASVDRLETNSDIVKNIELLLLENWPNETEWQFLQQGFEYCQITPEQQQGLIISLWFWAMNQQLESDFVYNAVAINKRIDDFLLTIETLIY
ncbi:MAG: methyltransferase domain-containing protein [Colwellia sp.]|nr:methyltransferase domain-containing protein [Colwellia sp.]